MNWEVLGELIWNEYTINNRCTLKDGKYFTPILKEKKLWRMRDMKRKEVSEGACVSVDNRTDYVVLSDLVLQTAVLSLCVLPDDHDVNVLVASLNSREGLAVHHIRIEV